VREFEWMALPSYKERLAYEHAELSERIWRLEQVLKYPGPVEGTEWTTPIDILRAQLHIMRAYQHILEHRCMLEQVDIEVPHE